VIYQEVAGVVPPVGAQDRLLAEFSEEEVQEILRQAGFRALAATEPQP